jgi:hypothetical protein
MESAPNQYETERLLSDALSHGDKSRLANILEVSLSEISQQCNPEELRKSYFYQFKRFLWGLCGVNSKAADVLMSDLNSSHELWKGSERITVDLSRLTGDVATEVTELVCARLEGKPLHVQRKEALDVMLAVKHFICGLERETGSLRPVA